MASITIRNLDESVKRRLRIQAARHNRSMEEEARAILQSALNREAAPPRNLGRTIHERFAKYGGVELELPPREMIGEPPAFD